MGFRLRLAQVRNKQNITKWGAGARFVGPKGFTRGAGPNAFDKNSLGLEMFCFRIGFVQFDERRRSPPFFVLFIVSQTGPLIKLSPRLRPLGATSTLLSPWLLRRWWKKGIDFCFSCFRVSKFVHVIDFWHILIFMCCLCLLEVLEKRKEGQYLCSAFGEEAESLDRRRSPVAGGEAVMLGSWYLYL